MEDKNDKLKKIINFNINKSLISLAREVLIIFEHQRMEKNLYETNRKFILDRVNSIIRETEELINQAL